MKSLFCLLLIAISFCFSATLISQSKFKEKVVFELKDKTDSWDKYFIKEESFESDQVTCNLYFNRTGDYVYSAPELGRLFKRAQNHGISLTRPQNEDVICQYINENNSSIVKYRSAFGVKMHSVEVGEGWIINSSTCKNSEDIAITTINKNPQFGDYLASFYINDSLVAIEPCKKDSTNKIHRFDDVSKRLEHQRWCAFSENGNKIYFVYKEGRYLVYLNGKQIHKSNFPYVDLGISNSGNYFFIEQDTLLNLKYVKDNNGKNIFAGSIPKYTIHLPGKTIDSVQVIINYKMLDDGGFCLEGEFADKSKFVFINNTMINKVGYSSSIKLIDKNNYLMYYNNSDINNSKNEFSEEGFPNEEPSELIINCNKKEYSVQSNELYLLNLDNNGNFAFFDNENNIVTNLNIKARNTVGANLPLYVSADGSNYYYAKSENKNNVSIYQNKTKLFSCPNNKFKILNIMEYNNGERNIESQSGIKLLFADKQYYFLHKGILSKPMISNFSLLTQDEKESYNQTESINYLQPGENIFYKLGGIIQIDFKNDSFYSLIKSGNSYFVNINNTVYQEIKDIDKIIPNNYFFDGKELIFYGIRQNKVYQFNIGEN